MKNKSISSLKFRSIIILVMLCMLALMVNQSWALKFLHFSDTDGQVFIDTAAHLISIDPTLGDTLTIKVPEKTEVLIFLSAECSVSASDNISWLDIDILVDGVATPLTAGDLALCTSHGTDDLDTWASSGINDFIILKKGTHDIQLQGQLVSDAVSPTWWINAISLNLIVKKTAIVK